MGSVQYPHSMVPDNQQSSRAAALYTCNQEEPSDRNIDLVLKDRFIFILRSLLRQAVWNNRAVNSPA